MEKTYTSLFVKHFKILCNGDLPVPDPNCGNGVDCSVSASNGKKADFTAYKGCGDSPSEDIGYFLRGDAIYKGHFDGSGIENFKGYN